MKVENASYEAYLAVMEEWKEKMQKMQATQEENESSEGDSYVSSVNADGMPIPSSSYDASGMMIGERPPMPPMPPVEESAELGLPTIENLDSLVAKLHETLSENWESYFEVEEEE